MGIPGWWSSPAKGEGPTKTRLRDRHQGTDEDLDTREAAAADAQSTPPESKAAPRARSRESERGEGREGERSARTPGCERQNVMSKKGRRPASEQLRRPFFLGRARTKAQVSTVRLQACDFFY